MVINLEIPIQEIWKFVSKQPLRQEMMIPEEAMKKHKQRMENMMEEQMMMTKEIKKR